MWPTLKFQDLASADRWSFTIGPFGSRVTTADYRPSGVPFIRGVNLARGVFLDDEFVFVDEAKADDVRSANVEPGDLVFTRKGTIGQVSMIPRNPRFPRYVISGSQMKARLKPALAVPEYYYYWFRSPAGQHALLSHTVTVGVPSLANSLETLRNIVVPHPPVKEQRAIAAALGALDDKIAVNDRIARTCRELGQTLTSKVVQSKIAIRDVCTIVMGQSPPGESYNETGHGLPFYQGTRDFGFHQPQRRVWSTAVTRHAAAGDVLVSVRAPVGQVNVASEACGIGRGLAALSAHAYPHTLHHALMADTAVWAPFEGEGTVFSSINKQQLHALRIRWPEPGEEAHLEPDLRVLDQRLMAALAESESLGALRDTLLPELMSGRLRVKDAEKVVEESV